MSATNGPNQDDLSALTRRVDALGELCQQLSEENADLRRQLSGGQAATDRPASDAAPLSAVAVADGSVEAEDGERTDRRFTRRNMVGLALGAAAATVVGTTVIEGGAKPAFASNGNAVIAGNVTTAETRTSVLYDGASGYTGVVLLGNDSTYSGTGANFPAGVGGWAGAGSTAGRGGVKNGVYGYTDNAGGNGVVGYQSSFFRASGDSTVGAGVLGLAFGASNIAVSGTNTLGTGVAGTSGSTAGSATAIVGTISSTSPGGFSAGVRGINRGTGGLGIGVYGSHNGSGWGVYATSISGVGVVATGGSGTGVSASGATAVSASGSTTGVSANGGTTGVSASGVTGVRAVGSGAGGTAVNASTNSTIATILATNTSTGNAIKAVSTNGRGAIFQGGPAQIRLIPAAGGTHPVAGAQGDLFVDKTGRLWFCKVTGNPATWKQIA